MTFCECRSYRVCVNCCIPNDAPTMRSTKGTPNRAGYLLKSLLYAASLSGVLENGGILSVDASKQDDEHGVK